MNARCDEYPEVSSVREFAGRLDAEDLPILLCNDDDFDETVVDFSEAETVTLTQVDEFGKQHTVILSAAIVTQLHPFLLIWKQNNCAPPLNDNPQS